MNTVVLKPKVQDLQADVISLLENISSLMGRANHALKTDSSGERYAQFQQEINEETHKVKHLELRMAIVAPMKAGKSTIINAIVGQDLLPSRNAAMTTLPTEIVFKADLPEPILVLPAESLCAFERAYRSLEYKMKNQGLEWVNDQLAEYPHLYRLSQKIQETVEFPAQSTVRGHEAIIEMLLDLNDLVRLSSLLEAKDLLSQCIDVPRIETPFWQAESTDESEVLGNLVIVDTPGPNEATSNLDQEGDSFKLASIVKEQLSKSSIVLIVLDFTQLKTEAAEKVKRDVQQVISLRGKENLYVLVNKVDQRLDNDMTPDQVCQFVAAEFGIGDDSDTNRVFEVSARFAFSAANFIQELEHSPGIIVATMKTVENLARQVYGRKWERELKRAIEANDTEDLREEAYLLWKDSGFDTFLKQAVNALMERAAPKCIKSALKLSQSRLIQLQEDVKLRSKGIAKEASELQRQVDELETDLERLNACYTKLNDVSKIKENLHHQLSKTLLFLQENAKVSLEQYWKQEESQRVDSSNEHRIALAYSANSIFPSLDEVWSKGSNLFRNFRFGDWLTKQSGAKIDQDKRLIECKTESEAEELTNQSINFAKQQINELLEETRKEAQQRIENARWKLNEQLKTDTKPIIDKARRRLNEAFNVNLSLPEFSSPTDDFEIAQPRIKSSHRYVDQGYETQKVQKRSFWHWLWIVPYEETTRVKRPDKREDYYTVSLEELIEEINCSITSSITNIEQSINKYIDEDFQDRVNLFFEDLDTYLRRYKESLQQAQVDKSLSHGEKEQLVAELDSLILEAASQIKKTGDCIQYVEDLLEG